MNIKRIFIKVEGVVQGVGFRPFVYNLAKSLSLNGYVNNNSEGVNIDIEGSEDNINIFLQKLKNEKPPLSRIYNIKIEEKNIVNYRVFTINESIKKDNKFTLISPDIAICKDCREDILNPENRRYRYAFTNCTNCGPRFSIIKSLPYDRDKTTMKIFKMCTDCYNEYKNPNNRRFHAQPNACIDCGPKLWVTDSNGKTINDDQLINDFHNSYIPVKYTQKKLKEGKIIVIKGLTGFHLVCDALNEDAVKLLRQRKNRPDKAFALMMKDIDTVKKYCYVNEKEEEILTGIKKPIVILNKILKPSEKKDDFSKFTISENIAPNQNTIGVMLPYTPIHELLFSEELEALIMTSANISGLPLEYKNDQAIHHLSNIADYFLLHNRDIFIPLDDSVVKIIDNKEKVIRRARGYVPEPINLNSNYNILACGSNMKNTFCINKENLAFLSQHNGDLENIQTYELYKRNIEHFKEIFTFNPSYLACDMHPEYMSTKYAHENNLPIINVQHHHAHIASVMAENNISHKIIGISLDGTGFGTDNKIWGSEFLICDLKTFSRKAHLDYASMIGGEAAIKEPYRMAISYLWNTYKEESESIIIRLYGSKGIMLLNILKRKINCPETSSMGRFFDAVSSLIGIRNTITYEGQASIELEAKINTNCLENYPYKIIQSNEKQIGLKTTNSSLSDYTMSDTELITDVSYIIEPNEIIKAIVSDKLNNISENIISVKFHNTIVKIITDMCKIIRNETGISEIALGGGVFQNSYLLSNTIKELSSAGFTVYTNKKLPCNDGSISFGQLVIADAVLKK